MNSRWIVACVGAVLWSGALADSETYCEASSVSFAWGPQYGGTAIDPMAAVALFEYDFVKDPRARSEIGGANWLAPTRRELDKRFKPGRRVVGTLCPNRRAWLRDQIDVVRTAAQSKVVDTGSRDGPESETHCFVFKPGHDPGAYVPRTAFRSTESDSLSPSAPRLANWLRAVSEEVHRRANLGTKDDSCIDDPPLIDPVYPDPSVEVRQRAMEDLRATQRLHCQFAKDSSEEPANLSVVFDLDFTARRGRAELFGSMYSVLIDTSIAGLILTNADAEKNRVSDVVTIMPYRTGGHELYPALKRRDPSA